LSVPREIAKVAVKLAEKNLEEFESKWVTEAAVDGIYEAIDWHNLCEQCGIEFLPKLGVMKNE
jgi:hypothetical protein